MLNTMMENENTSFANILIPFLRSKGGFEIQAKISKRGDLKNFWIKGGISLKEGGENFKGGWIPGHSFPSISNFIFSFSQ